MCDSMDRIRISSGEFDLGDRAVRKRLTASATPTKNRRANICGIVWMNPQHIETTPQTHTAPVRKKAGGILARMNPAGICIPTYPIKRKRTALL
jgi:hypothetical protein